MITEPVQANTVIAEAKADAISMARELLRQPHRPLLAAPELGIDIEWPVQYHRAHPKLTRKGVRQ